MRRQALLQIFFLLSVVGQQSQEVEVVAEKVIQSRISAQKRIVLIGYPASGKSVLANRLAGASPHGRSFYEKKTCYKAQSNYYTATTEPCYETNFLFGQTELPVVSVHDLPGIPGAHTAATSRYLENEVMWADFIIFTIPGDDTDLRRSRKAIKYLQRYSHMNDWSQGNIITVVTNWKDMPSSEQDRLVNNLPSRSVYRGKVTHTLCQEISKCDGNEIYFIDALVTERNQFEYQNFLPEKNTLADYIKLQHPRPVCFNRECPFRDMTSTDSLWFRQQIERYLYKFYSPNEKPGQMWTKSAIGRPVPILRSDNDIYNLGARQGVQYRQWKCMVDVCISVDVAYGITAASVLLAVIFLCVCKLNCKCKCSCGREQSKGGPSLQYAVKEVTQNPSVPDGLVLTETA